MSLTSTFKEYHMPHIKRKHNNRLPTIKFNGTIVPRKKATSYKYDHGWCQITIFWCDVDSDTPYHEKSIVYAADGSRIGHCYLVDKDNIKGYSGGCALYDAVRKTGYDDVPRINSAKFHYSIGYVLIPFN